MTLFRVLPSWLFVAFCPGLSRDEASSQGRSSMTGAGVGGSRILGPLVRLSRMTTYHDDEAEDAEDDDDRDDDDDHHHHHNNHQHVGEPDKHVNATKISSHRIPPPTSNKDATWSTLHFPRFQYYSPSKKRLISQ